MRALALRAPTTGRRPLGPPTDEALDDGSSTECRLIQGPGYPSSHHEGLVSRHPHVPEGTRPQTTPKWDLITIVFSTKVPLTYSRWGSFNSNAYTHGPLPPRVPGSGGRGTGSQGRHGGLSPVCESLGEEGRRTPLGQPSSSSHPHSAISDREVEGGRGWSHQCVCPALPTLAPLYECTRRRHENHKSDGTRDFLDGKTLPVH